MPSPSDWHSPNKDFAMKPHEHVILEIARERERQMTQEGWAPEHDDQHTEGALALAAAAYARHAAHFRDAAALGVSYETRATPPDWPWDREWWKPKNARRDLIRAAALLVAEIERLDRAGEVNESPL